MSKATIWNPNTAEKKVINVGEAIPTGFSLWTGGTASGQQAQEAIKANNPAPVLPANPTSNTISTGIANSNIASNLPSSSDSAMKLYADNSLTDSTKLQSELQANLDKFNAQRVADNQNQLKAEQENLKTIQTQKDNQVAGYDAQMSPLKDKAVGIYDSMLNSIKDTNYSELTKQKLDLTNDIVSYSKMFSEEIAQAELGGGLSSVASNRKNQVIENYTSKIAIAEAASKAIDGNFNLAFDIMDKGANAIQNLTTDRINFINTIQTLFSSKETDSRNKILSLTSEQSKLLDQAKTDAETKLSNIQKNKDTIMELMKTNPIVANKANITLTDTPEQISTKLNDFYVANPQFTPDNQAVIKKAMEKYYDAGISSSDSLATIQNKIKNSRIYQNEVISNANKVDDVTGSNLLTPGTIGGQCGDYVHKIVDNVPALGDLYEEKMAKANVSNENWQIGDVLIQKTRMPYGHVSVVTGVNGNQVTITESNWNLDEKVGTRTLTMGDPSVSGVYRGGTLKNIATGFSESAMNYAKDILAGRMKLENVPGEKMKNEVIRAKAELEKTEKPLADKLMAESLDDKINLLDEAINSSGMKGTVGPYALSRWTPFSPDKSERQNFIATVEQLIQQETIDKLIQSKAAGATYGALSDGEREMLAKAASKIGTWRILDKTGKVTGYEISEDLMKKELETIKDLAQKAKDRILGDSVIVPPGQMSEDDAYQEYLNIKNQ
jgi:hypothetical protein